jgi:YidC/Oxa1 family membrane protein insertase
MSFGSVLYTILIGPIKLFFEVVYSCVYNITANPGISIIFLSLAINFLVLPLYMRADAMQEEEKDIQNKLSRGVAHIRKTFKGDERMMILQTYYRQNHYKPTYVLRGAAPLFLEIPFFIAAYSFLSTLSILEGVPFGPISDLSRPDGLIHIGALTVNLLPILMTLVNFVSSAIFTKGYPLKTKIQLYGMAVFFLIFLYGSPSGLVFYWTLNNLFSLIKTIFYKLKHPKEVLMVIASVAGIVSIVMGIRYIGISVVRVIFFTGLGLLLQIPAIGGVLNRKGKLQHKERTYKPEHRLFIMCMLLMAILTGVMIPASVVRSSPLEFVSVNSFYHPLWYVMSAGCLAFGTFIVWCDVFYGLAKDKGKVMMEGGACALCVCAVIDYMFFGRNLGTLSTALQFEDGMAYTVPMQLINALVLAVAAGIVILICRKFRSVLATVVMVGAIALACMSGLYLYQAGSDLKEYSARAASQDEMASLPLSRTGKNVVVLMLDRAMGEYIPYIMEEKPELLEAFSGFRYYSNTISYGGNTNFGAPALFGGYEYTPEKLNLRDSEPLVDKHDEALKVMPNLFTQNGYDVTVCDPSYAGYQWIPDLSIFDDIPGIHTYITDGAFVDEELQAVFIKESKRNFFCYGLMKTMPLVLQPTFYERGNYRSLTPLDTRSQGVHDIYTADGFDAKFMQAYAVLEHMSDMTRIDDGGKGSFIMMVNNTTHEPVLLQKEEYEMVAHVDNSEYGEEDRSAGEAFGKASDRILHMDDSIQAMEYHSNMAAYLKLKEWFDYLKENGVYDNTRIILVADHGEGRDQMDDLLYPFGDGTMDLSAYFPLLMVKDFDATGFSVSDEFMSNADVASLATEGLIDDPVNPYTGNPIGTGTEKKETQYILRSDKWRVEENNGNTFLPGIWLSVHDDIWDTDNWEVVGIDTTLPEK